MKPSNCDGRYPHYLQKLDVQEGPTQILCVDVTGELQQPPGKHTEMIEQFTGWYAVDMIRRDGRLYVASVQCGNDRQSYWSMLADVCSHIGMTWIVSYQCVRVWALLGLWGRLESGQCRISGGDYRAIANPDEYGMQTSPGLLVAEDPPCVVQLRVGTQPGGVMWVDCRNWGIELPITLKNGNATARHLSEIVKQLEDACINKRLCPISATAAGWAYRSWRTHHLTHAVHCHVHPAALKMEFDAHIGGRCECFRIGKITDKTYHLDLRSCYGHIMQTMALPTLLLEYTANAVKAREIAMRSPGECISTVSIVASEPSYPCRTDADTIYPVGRYKTILCGPELSDAVDKQRTLLFHNAAIYKRVSCLEGYANAAYQIRQDADRLHIPTLASWAKYMLNAIVGKASQRIKRWEIVPGAKAPDKWGEWQYCDGDGTLHRWRALAGVVQQEKEGFYTPDAVPAISAFICSQGRMRLLQLIRIAGWDEVYYCDTDSLICSERGYRKLYAAGEIADGQIGKLEIRGICDKLEIRGIKYYLEGKDVTCAGVQRGIIVQSPDGLGQWVIPQGSAGAKLRGPQGAKRKLVRWPKAAPYRHGVVMSDGKVLPIRLEE